MKRILFSPIGTTDPISNCADGPLLHICRVYRPDLVYLYLSKEICEIQNKDDRYRYSLSRLSKATGHDLEITSIERNELTDVHEFDYFYNEFKNILKEIHEKFPEAEILLNVSSGTPAMQCTLYSLAVLGEFAGLSAIQVSTPEKKHNPRRDRLEDYDKELYWETNEDNSDNFTNRCKILEEKNALARFTEKTIVKYLDVYDYEAAWTAAKSIESFLHPAVLTLLEIGRKRIQLDYSGMAKLADSIDYNPLPVQSGDHRKIFEYALWMQMKFRKKQYSDFIKGLTPVFFAVLKFYLKNKCRLDIDEDYSNGKKGKSWNSAKIHTNLDLLDCLQKDYKDFNFGTIYADHLVAIALDQRFNQDFAYKTIVQDLNEKIMKRIRNEVAHEIMPVTEEKINAMTGLTPQKIFDLFIKYIENSGVRIPDGAWNSYDDMNDKIKSYLEI